MQIIPRNEVKSKLKGLQNGTIFSITFIKKDGSVRLLNSIKGTRKGVNGEGLKYDADEKGLIPVYDLQLAKKDPSSPEKAWRMVNTQTVQRICINHEEFLVQD